jgi:hypothetical protein
MPKNQEDPKLTPISENELGQIEGGFTELPVSDTGTSVPINFSCPSQTNNAGCPSVPPPPPAVTG